MRQTEVFYLNKTIENTLIQYKPGVCNPWPAGRSRF